jgi:hypothetical protein
MRVKAAWTLGPPNPFRLQVCPEFGSFWNGNDKFELVNEKFRSHDDASMSPDFPAFKYLHLNEKN